MREVKFGVTFLIMAVTFLLLSTLAFAVDPLIQKFTNVDLSGQGSDKYKRYDNSTRQYVYSQNSATATSTIKLNITSVKDIGSNWSITLSSSGYVSGVYGTSIYDNYSSIDIRFTINDYGVPITGYYFDKYYGKTIGYDNNNVTMVVPKNGLQLKVRVYVGASGVTDYNPYYAYYANAVVDKLVTLNLNNLPTVVLSNTSDVYLNGQSGHDVLTVSGKLYDAEGQNVVLKAKINNIEKQLNLSPPTTLPQNPNFTFTWNVNSEGFIDGAYTNLEITATDSTGDTTVLYRPFTVIVDRVKPIITVYTQKVKGGGGIIIRSNEQGCAYVVKEGQYGDVIQLDTQVDEASGTKADVTSANVDTSITAPLTDGFYKVYYADRAGNISTASEIVEVDSTPPKLMSAKLSGTTIILTYDEALESSSVPAVDDFFVTAVGSNTAIYAVANEDAVDYNVVYQDMEVDPKDVIQWRYVHDPYYFENNNGTATFSGQWLDSPKYTFDKYGKYSVICKAKDRPLEDGRFSNYMMWSNESPRLYVYVHHRPVAQYSVNLSKSGSDYVPNVINLSYDLDHMSRDDKGIVESKWQYKEVNATTWIDGLPQTLQDGKKYLFNLEVKDLEGAWSVPVQQMIDTANPPIVDIKAYDFTVTIMLDASWQGYYFDTANGIDDDGDGEIDRYPRIGGTDIKTDAMPINDMGYVSYPCVSIKAGYKVKGYIKADGQPDSVALVARYKLESGNVVSTSIGTSTSGGKYSFEWYIPQDIMQESYICFDVSILKGQEVYGCEKWMDVWHEGNADRRVFFVKGKAQDDVLFNQSY